MWIDDAETRIGPLARSGRVLRPGNLLFACLSPPANIERRAQKNRKRRMMMEINITEFFNSEEYEYSDTDALQQAGDNPMLTSGEELQAMRDWAMLDWARSAGGWTAEQIGQWSDRQVNALFIRLVSADMREMEDLCTSPLGQTDWEEYDKLASAGAISGKIFKSVNAGVYYCLE